MCFRSFFSVKNSEQNGKICLQGYFKPVFESILHSGARGYSKVYAEEHLLLEPVKLDFRGFESRRMQKHIASGLVLSFGTQKRTVHEIVCENVFIQTFVIIRQSESASVHLAEQCKSKPCLRMDTVLSQTVPKDFFPHCAGGTQIFSRCFCMSDNEATLLPLKGGIHIMKTMIINENQKGFLFKNGKYDNFLSSTK